MIQNERSESAGGYLPANAHQQHDSVSADASDQPDQSDKDFAQQLRAARAERGLSLDACGQALKLPVRLLRQLESGCYTGIDYQIYLRGYLCKYGRYLGLTETAIEAELLRLQPRQPDLVCTGGVSRTSYLLERYAQAASYIVLTVVILVPVVWFGLQGGLRKGANLIPLDSSPVAVHEGRNAPSSSRHIGKKPETQKQRPAADNPEPKPLLASIAPFAVMREGSVADEPAPVASAPAKASSPAHITRPRPSLSIHLDGASWVQVSNDKGQRLEYALLPAGTDKTYSGSAAQQLNVDIGNADAATVKVGGKTVDLARYRHANVARFAVNLGTGKTAQTHN